MNVLRSIIIRVCIVISLYLVLYLLRTQREYCGSFSKAAAALPKGGTAMFALLALGGDLGCSGGPTLVGMVSSRMGDNLKMGILAGVIFPVLLLTGIILCRKEKRKKKQGM